MAAICAHNKNIGITQLTELLKNINLNGSNGTTILAKKQSDSKYFLLRKQNRGNSVVSEEIKLLLNILKPNILFKVLQPLEYFLPTECFKIAHKQNFSKASLQSLNPHFSAFINGEQLSAQNAFDVMTSLLQIEDLTSLTEYIPLAQKGCTIRKITKAHYKLELKNGNTNIEEIVTPYSDEVMLVSQLDSSLALRGAIKYPIDLLLLAEDSINCYIGRITDVTTKNVEFTCTDDWQPHENEAFDVIFRPNRVLIRYQLNALKDFASDTAIQKYLYPVENVRKEIQHADLNYKNAEVEKNPEQSQAVQNIVNGAGAHAPFIIFGPPGTGKTTTVVESILQLLLRQPDSRILVTAGSNSACDTIALRICKYFNGSQSRQTILRLFSKSVERKGKYLIDKKLLSYSNLALGHYLFPAKVVIEQFSVIVATLCTVGKLVSGAVRSDNKFTHIFIDEVGASTEPEALIAIVGMKRSHECNVILSGDHKQLGPVLKSEIASDLGLKKSLMERLLQLKCYEVDSDGNYDRTMQIRLCLNYRSHAEIVRLYNSLYYENKLRAEATQETLQSFKDWPILTNSEFPIIFQAVHGVIEKDELTPSVSNRLEINVLFFYVRSLLKGGHNDLKICGSDIGIITPYRSQCKRIEQRCKERNAYKEIEVGSVETFQGREKSVIIVSFVRSFNGLGFIRSPRRLNVIISRAKSLLILIGNPLTLRKNADYNFLIEECKKHGTYLHKKKLKHHHKRQMKDN